MMMCLMTPSFADIRKDASSQLLTRAIEYFQSGKYHEALLLFQRLDNKYKLNTRFQGYIGVCYFYDGDYKRSVAVLGKISPNLQLFAPQERAVYLYCMAESNFRLGHYRKALPLFESHILLCHNNEKGDSLMRIGLCYLALDKTNIADEYLNEATLYYRKFNDAKKLEKMAHYLQGLK